MVIMDPHIGRETWSTTISVRSVRSVAPPLETAMEFIRANIRRHDISRPVRRQRRADAVLHACITVHVRRRRRVHTAVRTHRRRTYTERTRREMTREHKAALHR